VKQREPCGCTHDGQRWLFECSAHKAENDALHRQALRDHGNPASPTDAPADDWLALPASPTEAA